MFSKDEFTGSEIVFLLEIEFASKVNRFSSFPIDIVKNDGSNVPFLGTLADVEISEQTEMIGIDIEGNSAKCKVIFPMNLIELWRKGFVLEGSKGELSMICRRQGENLHTYENRSILLTGIIQQPQFGDPLEPGGFCSFTLEQKPFDTTGGGLLVDPGFRISAETFPALNLDLYSGMSAGQIYPLCIAKSGTWKVLGNGSNVISTYITPAYVVENPPAAIGDPRYLMISAYEVSANRVSIRDDKGNSAMCPVSISTDAIGNVYSRADIGGLGFNVKDSIADPDVNYFVSWSNIAPSNLYHSGGIKSPFSDHALSGGGELVMWGMMIGGYKIDLPAWDALSTWLNTYEFHGYIDDPTITAWDWLRDNIIPFLPIEVQNGTNGIKPIIALLYAHVHVVPISSIQTGPDFTITSAITTQTDTADLYNDIVLEFAKNQDDKYLCEQRIGYQLSPTGIKQSNDNYAMISQSRYGKKSIVFSADYVYLRDTAFKICLDKIRSSSFPIRSVEITADAQYGYLQIGDVISLSSDSLFLEETKCVIVAKKFGSTRWEFVLAIEDNPFITKRYVGG